MMESAVGRYKNRWRWVKNGLCDDFQLSFGPFFAFLCVDALLLILRKEDIMKK